MDAWEESLNRCLNTYRNDREKLALASCSITLDKKVKEELKDLSSEVLLERVGTDSEKAVFKDTKIPLTMREILIYRYEGLIKIRSFLGTFHSAYRLGDDKF